MAHSTDSRGETNVGGRTGVSRRWLIGMTGATLVAGGWSRVGTLAQESTPESTPAIQDTGQGDMPTTGGARPGPVGQQPSRNATSATLPMNIRVEAAGIDAEIETLSIVDGHMEDPTGPWVVSWYQQSGALGEPGNALFAGHVDFWGVGPSVFYNVRDLVEGDLIVITGENGQEFTYAVLWNETLSLDELISGGMAEITAPTDDQVITLFTCGGEFDYVNGEYLSRTVVRAERIRPELESTPEA